MIKYIPFVFRLKLYPCLHRLSCKGNLGVLMPTEEHMIESGDNEVYMQCDLCEKKYHLANLTPENGIYDNVSRL